MFFNVAAFGVLTILYCAFTFYVVSTVVIQEIEQGEKRDFGIARFGGGIVIGMSVFLKTVDYSSPAVVLLWVLVLTVVAFFTCVLEIGLAVKKAVYATLLFVAMLTPGCLLICSSFELDGNAGQGVF